MSFKVTVPHWLCEKILDEHRSLEAYEQQNWRGALKVIDAYWDDLARESMRRVNERLKDG
jgi:hypothetical protein